MTTSGGSPSAAQVSRNKKMVLLMFLLPVMMIGAAYFVFFTGIGVPQSTTNKGVLVRPAQPLSALSFVDSGQSVVSIESLHGQWVIIIPGSGGCDQPCIDKLYLSRQIRTALGKESHRLSRLYLSFNGPPSMQLQDLLTSQHPDLAVARTSEIDWQNLLLKGGQDVEAHDGYYLVDPRGYVMMAYTDEHSGGDTLSDLRFLMKYSSEIKR